MKNSSVNYLEIAGNYLKENNIDFYSRHIPYINKYRDFLYSQDKKYNSLDIIINNIRQNSLGEDELFFDKKNIARHLTKIQLLAIKEFASSLFNEQIDFKSAEDIENTKHNNEAVTKSIKALEKYYIENDAWKILETSMIEVMGVGSIAIVTDYDSVYGIQHICYPANCILPLKIVGNKIVDVCFVGTDTNNTEHTRLTIFRQNVVSKIIASSDLNVANKKVKTVEGYKTNIVTLDKDGKVIEDESFEYNIAVRPFIILKPFNRNVIEYSNAFGYPIYWDYLDIIDDIDDLYNLKKREANLSKRRIFMSSDLIKNNNGKITIPPDLEDAFITILDGESSNSSVVQKFFQEFSPNPILDVYDKAMENSIRYFSASVGLGSNTLSLNKITAPTATQIISENTEKFTNTLKHYSMMRNEFIVFNQCLLYFINKYIDSSVSYDIKIMFNTEDNIIEDTNALTERALKEKNAGVLSTYLYLKNVKGLSGQALVDELARHGLDSNGNEIDV